MGERYFLTGVQLGMLKAFVRSKKEKEATDLLCQIENKQFIGNVQYLVDIRTIKRCKKCATK
jgi:hypothetical protein